MPSLPGSIFPHARAVVNPSDPTAFALPVEPIGTWTSCNWKKLPKRLNHEGDVVALEHRVKEIIAEQLGISEEEVQPHYTFSEDLGADSLDLLELILAVEEEFEIDIADDEAEKLNTVNDLVRFLQNRSQ